MAIPVSHTDCIDHFLEYLVRGKLPSSILPSDSCNTDPVKFRTPIKTTAYMFLRPRVRAYIYRIVRKKTPPLGVNFCAELFFQTRRGTQTKCWLLGRSRRDVSVYRGRPELEAPKIDYSGPESGRIGVSRLYYYKSYILPTTYERALCSYERLILAVHTGRSSLGLPTV